MLLLAQGDRGAFVKLTAAQSASGSDLPPEVQQAIANGEETLVLEVAPDVYRVYAFDYVFRTDLRFKPLQDRYLELAGTGCFPDPKTANWTPLFGLFSWQTLPVTYQIDLTNAPSYLHQKEVKEVKDAIRRAFSTWDAEEVPPGQFFQEVKGTSPAQIRVEWVNIPPELHFYVLGIAFIDIDFTQQEVVSGKILLNADIDLKGDPFFDHWGILPHDCGWDPPPSFPDIDFVYDIQSVMTHEIGHILNLGHVYSPEVDIGQTMLWIFSPYETFKQTLGQGDKKGLRFMYEVPGK